MTEDDVTVASLADLGWDEAWRAALTAASTDGLFPGRVSRIDRGAMTVLTESGPCRARAQRGLSPAVGDWVAIAPGASAHDLGVVTVVLPRRSCFRRATGPGGTVIQVVAANIDTVLLLVALDAQLNIRHLQRYLALSRQSGAVPAVVLTKGDLDVDGRRGGWLDEIRAAMPGVPTYTISTTTGHGTEGLVPYLGAGHTVALLGLSGAGKSTLVNTLAGTELLATGGVRADGQGRHTTTHRQLVLLPTGGMVIDTPGMRALSVSGAGEGVDLAFADVAELAGRCELRECSHSGERGCEISAALADGRLSPERLASWSEFRQQTPAGLDAARRQVVERKRRKAAAKVARRVRRAETVKTRPVDNTPAAGPWL
jgi:ribosome biogenesis GTPase